jgi:hypothetical protein
MRNVAKDAARILEEIRARLDVLRPDKDEHDRLAAADRELLAVVKRFPLDEPMKDEAPYGYKADGTPRKRRAPTAATQSKVRATRALKASARE